MRWLISLFVLTLFLTACGEEKRYGSRSSEVPDFVGGPPVSDGLRRKEARRNYDCPPQSEDKRLRGTMKERIQQVECYGQQDDLN